MIRASRVQQVSRFGVHLGRLIVAIDRNVALAVDTPPRLVYEQLADRYELAIRGVLKRLQIDSAAICLEPPRSLRQANELSGD
jgi:hypothetical protein